MWEVSSGRGYGYQSDERARRYQAVSPLSELCAAEASGADVVLLLYISPRLQNGLCLSHFFPHNLNHIVRVRTDQIITQLPLMLKVKLSVPL